MKVTISSNFIPFFPANCEFERISHSRFKVLVNDNEELIDLDKTSGDLLENLLPLMDGKRSVKEITELVIKGNKGKFSKTEVRKIIVNLFKWGLISTYTDKDCNYSGGKDCKFLQMAYLSSLTSYPMEMQKRLEKTTVAVIGAKYISPLLLRSLYLCGVRRLKLMGNQTIEAEEIPFFCLPDLQENTDWYSALLGEASFLRLTTNIDHVPDLHNASFISELKEVDMFLVLVPYIKPELVSDINKICLSTNTKLLFAGLSFSSATIGPVVIPYESACLKCRELRCQENYCSLDSTKATLNSQECHPYYNTFKKVPAMFNSFLAAYTHIVSGFACAHILDTSTALINREICIDFHNAETTSYFILKAPRCPACGCQIRHPKYKIFGVE